ncbi:MAG: trehalose-phosphatase [Actinomycetota bacterium]
MQLNDCVDAFKRDPLSSGFILDFDGTLSVIVSEPDEAVAVDGVAELLAELAAKYAIVALVSGRRAEQLSEKLNVSGLRYIGLYGAEEIIDSVLVQAAEAVRWRSIAAHLALEAQGVIEAQGWDGCLVEDKDLSVSLHFRNAKDIDVAGQGLMSWAHGAASRHGFTASRGRMVVELRPVGISKADAFDRVVDDLALKTVVLAGDDLTDLESMIQAGEKADVDVLRVAVDSDESPEGLHQHSDIQVAGPLALVDILKGFL